MLEIRRLNKTYLTKGAPPVHALVDVSVKLEQTGMVFVLGKSGSGKSTFLNVVGGLDKYDSGEIIIKEKSSSEFKGSDFDSYRNTYLGFIFQEYNLINEFTIGRNIALAMELQSRKATPADVDGILKLVGLDGLADRMPMQISGGQRQRVAIARALIKNPEIIMADEPTGALDSATGASIFQTLQNLSRTRLVLIVSHDREFAERYGDRIIEFSDGRIISDMIKRDEGFTEEAINTGDIQKVEEIIDVSKKAGLSTEHMQILTKLLDEKKAEEPALRQKKRRGAFVQTKEEMLNLNSKNQTPFKLIKSSLPQRDAFKMASSSMKHKRVRLFFSIFLSVVAITLFGFSNVVGSFNVREIAKSLMRDYAYDHMVVSKTLSTSDTFSGNGSGIAFSESEREKMSSLTNGGVADFYNFSASLPLVNKVYDSKDNEEYYNKNITGMVTCEDFSKMGFNVPEVYGRYPETENEILITNYIAETFLTYGLRYYDGFKEEEFFPEKINDILSYNLSFGYMNMPLKIVGIINLPIERYKDLKLNSTKGSVSATLKSEFAERKNFDISFIYGLPAINNLLGSRNSGNYIFEYGIEGLEANSNDKYFYALPTKGLAYSQYASGNTVVYLGADGSTQMPEPQKGQVIINLSQYLMAKDRLNGKYYYENDAYALTAGELADYASRLGLFGKKQKIGSYFGDFYYQKLHYEFYSAEFEVIGVISEASVYYDYEIKLGIFNDDEFKDMTKESKAESVMVYLKDQRTASDFIDSFVGEFKSGHKGITKNYVFSMPFSENVYMVSMVFKVLSVVFFWMSIVLCVFAALLLLNFISASVNLKKKEIGILRAIGARKIDVISIFLWEGIIIGLIVLAASAVLVFGTVILFNNLIGSLISMPFTMLVFGLLTLVYMFLICFATIGIASILPARRVAGMKPMDAIRSV